jgi:ribosomal protein S18 acetylase RimI-like enzyme
MPSLAVYPLEPSDISWAEGLIGARLAGRLQARLGDTVDALAFPGFVAKADGERCGIVTFLEGEESVEVVYLQATESHAGVGTMLIEAVMERAAGRRVWLVTTNDNLDALRFYQRRGFRLIELHPGAVDEARRHLKPDISPVGFFGIPLRDELVLERRGADDG